MIDHRPSNALHVYAGPTLDADTIHALAPEAIVQPPAQHGDLLRLTPSPGDTVLLIDGLWHQVPPVRHKEILELLHRGTRVVGAASMGALRAAELAPYGMIGVGWVYQQYATGRIEADDEVALVHTPDGRPLSTALVCLRYALQHAADTAVITKADAERLLELARAMPFHRRSWAALGHAAAQAGLAAAHRHVVTWLGTSVSPDAADIKAADARLAILLASVGKLPAATAAGNWQHEPWRTSHLRRWIATYRPVSTIDDAQVPLLPALQYAQLYDPRFPACWRRRVLAWIAGRPETTPTDVLEDQALAAARDRGLHLGALAPAQVEHWATPTEIITLCQRELLLRILIRSARLDPTASVWPETPADANGLLDLTDCARVAATAWRVNRAVEASGPGRTIGHLDPDRIRTQLARHWGLIAEPVDSRELTAAARDRGILSGEAAVTQARPFYLATRTAPAVPAASAQA
ncbi:TfuA-like protein [Actinomadura alba]|uniref:TfuA-like core domain-containing protein n=1 Tax=Actinomadura alba TaxID=406431 RepID=A0ABR7M2R7_9ACTN|nr:TfuA-like protein [Actinomadura alba]MBC6471384.1 hypothetical protein [Actinomadura alba]